MTDRPAPETTPAAPTTTVDRLPLRPDRALEIEVENPNGAIDVRPHDGPAELVLTAVKHGRPGGRRFEEAQLVVDVADNRVRIAARLPGVAGLDLGDLGRAVVRRLAEVDSGDGGGVRYDLTVELPRRLLDRAARLQLRTASGDIAVAGIPGTIDAASASGDVVLSDAAGQIAAQTASGDLVLIRPSGRVTLRAVSGDTRLEDGRLTSFAVSAVSGDVAIATELDTGRPSRIETVSGDVHLALGAAAASLAFRTVSGDAVIGAPFRSVGKRAWILGGGDGAEVAVKTVSGDLRAQGRVVPVRPSERDALPLATPVAPSPPVAPEPPAPPAAPSPVEPVAHQGSGGASPEAQPDRLAILRAVERGELDVDEALARLEGDEPDLSAASQTETRPSD